MSSKTYTVRLQGRTGLIYAEGAGSISIDAEVFFDPPGVTVYVDGIQAWDPPNQQCPISTEEKSVIVTRIKEDLEREGYVVDIA